MAPKTIAVVGSIAMDLIIVTNRVPASGETIMAKDYAELLGGKGQNSAIATYRTCHNSTAKTKGLREADTPGALPTPEEERPSTQLDGGFGDDDINVRMVGYVGEDTYADMFRSALKENGVDLGGVIPIPGTRSTVCFVLLEDFTAENRILVVPGAMEHWKKEDFSVVEDLGRGVIPDLIIAQLEIRKEVVEAMIETAGKAGIDFVLNAAPADPVTNRTYQYITHLLVNESEAAIMSGRDLDEVNEKTWGQIANEFINRGVKNVVITLGERGAYYATTTGDQAHVPGYRVPVVDTTGAGDTFTGAYASDYLRQKALGEWNIKSAVVRANKAAALTVTKLGAQDGIPWANEIELMNAELNEPENFTLKPKEEVTSSE